MLLFSMVLIKGIADALFATTGLISVAVAPAELCVSGRALSSCERQLLRLRAVNLSAGIRYSLNLQGASKNFTADPERE